jgi:cytochrome c-type biogenesis protein CcmH
MRQVERALKLDPRNVKALSLAGADAFERNDFSAAVKFWEKAISIGPADNPIVQQLEESLADARARSGISAPVSNDKPASKGVVSGTVSGTVTLSSSLAAKAQPDDTVFVFARAVSGSRMPLALLRKQVKDLPLQFTLDDSLAMTPANKLTDAKQVIVGARISKSGNAAPQPGDLSGQTGAIAVGTANLKLEITEQVGR